MVRELPQTFPIMHAAAKHLLHVHRMSTHGLIYDTSVR